MEALPPSPKFAGVAGYDEVLYQSTSTDTCGVCAVANLLSLYGVATTRNQIAGLFRGAKSESETVVTRPILLRAVRAQFPGVSLFWKRIAPFSFARFSCALKEAFDRGAPALITFNVRHRKKDWYGLHVAVAINADNSGIGIIDSLGRRNRQIPNATIMPTASAIGWAVAGAPVIVTRGSAFILHGLPELQKTKVVGS